MFALFSLITPCLTLAIWASRFGSITGPLRHRFCCEWHTTFNLVQTYREQFMVDFFFIKEEGSLQNALHGELLVDLIFEFLCSRSFADGRGGETSAAKPAPPPQPPSSSTVEPMGDGASKNRKYLRRKMKGAWQEDEHFITKHFPSDQNIRNMVNTLMDTHYNANAQRWKRISSASKPRLISALRVLFNAILAKAYIPTSRRTFLKPKSQGMKVHRPPLPTPELLLCGAGAAQYSNTTGRPVPEYSSVLVPVQVMLESEYKPTKRHLCAAQANEVFQAQDNRRFIYAGIITERYLRLFMIDPSGGVNPPRALDYHARPTDLCAIVVGLATLDEDRAGFDTSMSWGEDGAPTIRFTERGRDTPEETVSYLIQERIFKSSRIIGRATTCWLVISQDKSPKLYVIKDAWVALTEFQNEMEGTLIDYARKKGVTRGLVRVRHQAKLKVGRSDDSIVRNRRIHPGMANPDWGSIQDRVHTRMVMETCGKPIWHFHTKRELIVAIHDAIDGE